MQPSTHPTASLNQPPHPTISLSLPHSLPPVPPPPPPTPAIGSIDGGGPPLFPGYGGRPSPPPNCWPDWSLLLPAAPPSPREPCRIRHGASSMEHDPSSVTKVRRQARSGYIRATKAVGKVWLDPDGQGLARSGGDGWLLLHDSSWIQPGRGQIWRGRPRQRRWRRGILPHGNAWIRPG